MTTLCGLQLHDLEFMTIGMLFDFIDDYIEMKSGKEEVKVREATQEDFDNF